MRCLDNRRLLAQHSEAHVCLSVLHKHFEQGIPTGWSNGPQARPFHGRRSALVEYHDDIVVPELARRGFQHRSPLTVRNGVPVPDGEQGYQFWDCVTWREVLRDCRHLIEKHDNDRATVMAARNNGRKTRVVLPAGQTPGAVQLVLAHAISHVFNLPTESSMNEEKAQDLRSQLLLDPPVLQ